MSGRFRSWLSKKKRARIPAVVPRINLLDHTLVVEFEVPTNCFRAGRTNTAGIPFPYRIIDQAVLHDLLSRSNRSGGSEMIPNGQLDMSNLGRCCSTIGDPASVLYKQRVLSFKIFRMIGKQSGDPSRCSCCPARTNFLQSVRKPTGHCNRKRIQEFPEEVAYLGICPVSSPFRSALLIHPDDRKQY